MTTKRLASHYVIRDLLDTVECSDKREVRKKFEKYMGRYLFDKDLVKVGCMTVAHLEKMGSESHLEIRSRLNELMNARRMYSLKGYPALLSLLASIR